MSFREHIKRHLQSSAMKLGSNVKQFFEAEVDKVLSHAVLIEAHRSVLNECALRFEVERKKNQFFDYKLAKQLEQTCKALLNICERRVDEDFVPYAFAAIQYFTKIKDVQDDFEQPDGFDDDKEVIDEVIRFFSLERDLKRELETLKTGGSRSA